MLGSKLLSEYMQRKGLRQAAVAAVVGTSQPVVSRWLAGKRQPGVDEAWAIEVGTQGEVPMRAWVRRKN